MIGTGKGMFRRIKSAMIGVFAVASVATSAHAVNLLDPRPIVHQETNSFTQSSDAVQNVNFTYGFLGGTLDGVANGMGLISVSTPMPFISSFGIQGDLAYGFYDGNKASESAAAALHIFWRDPGVGMIGVYADWGYISPVHLGRLGIETSYYHDRWTVEGLFAMEFGQNVYTKFVDEVDLSYYFDDNTKGSIGHRFISRGNVFNVGFEKQFGQYAGSPLSIFGEAEIGEDSFYQAFVGVKAVLGSGAADTMIARDRAQNVRIRIPRNLSSVTQCARVDNPFPAPSWLTNLHLIKPGSETETLCASERSLNRVSTSGIFKP